MPLDLALLHEDGCAASAHHSTGDCMCNHVPGAAASLEPGRYPRGVAGGLARDPRLRAWRAFVEAHTAVMDVLERELTERRGISLTWYDALLQLSEAPGQRLRMSELADSIVI